MKIRRFLLPFIMTFSLAVVAVHAADMTTGFSFFGGYIGTGYSTSFANSSFTGQALGKSNGTVFRNYAGALPARTAAPVMSVIDNSIVFADVSPTAAEVQQTTSIDFCVTVQINGGNTINDFSYQVSTWGVSGLDAALLRTNASTDTITSPAVIRYRISFPNTDTNGTVFLGSGENNYIRCYVNNNAGGQASSVFQIKVSSTPAGALTILQPDEKSGVASIEPLIKAVISGSGVVDPSAIQIKLEDSNGALVLAPVSGTYDMTQRTVSYKYAGPALVADAIYKVTVSLNDASDSVTFRVKAGAIADLVPYPSPFDPKVQPITIRYALNRNADVTVNIYDRNGKLVRNIITNEARGAGIEEEAWDGANYAGDTLANGVYFCELIAKDSEGEHRRHSALAIFGR
jgi:hypothetical protein